MNMNFWAEFWAAMPGEMRVFLGILIGVTIHFLQKKSLGIGIALTGSFISLLGGIILTVAIASNKGWDLKDYWYIATPCAIMVNYLIGGMNAVGKQFEKSPVKWIVDVGLEVYTQIKDKLKGGKDNDDTTV